MDTFKLVFTILIIGAGFLTESQAQSKASVANESAVPEVEWYPPEIEKGLTPEHAKVIISGRTNAGSTVKIDGNRITMIKENGNMMAANEAASSEEARQMRMNCKAYEHPDLTSHVVALLKKGETYNTLGYSGSWIKVILPNGVGFTSPPCFLPATAPGNETSTRANFDGFFETSIELPQGLAQIPILITTPANTQKTFLISVDVKINLNKNDTVKMNNKVSPNKPPAAAKNIRLWAGLGFTYQSDSQSTSGASDLAFSTVQVPGIIARGGYWGDRWGVDFYFRDAPGEIKAAPPFQIQSDAYHWRTMEVKGLYQFDRGPNSRLRGRPSQWQLRFGTQIHQIPFFEISNSNVVTIKDHKLTTATLGMGLLLGQEQNWSYEFAVGLQQPISSAAEGNSTFKVSSPLAYEAQIGAAYKFAPNWRLGIFSYTQSLTYNYEFQNENGALTTGKQKLFNTTFDLRLGYEF